MARFLAVLAAFVCCGALAGEPVRLVNPDQFPPPVPLHIPDKYMTSNSAPPAQAKEGTQAINGVLYTVVAPIFDGSDGNVSFIRLGNANTFAVAFTVVVVGNVSATTYGTAFYTVPPFAAPQIPYNEVLKKAGVTGLVGADTGYAFYVRSGQFLTGFQHVIFNLDSLFFENASICTFSDNLLYSGLNQVMVDIHTSIVEASGYPSVLFLHNYSTATTSYRGYVFESETGAQKGSVVVTLGPNQSYVFPWSLVEDTINWTPVGAEGHANILWERVDGGTFNALVGQSVYNQQFESYVNMSVICPLNN